MDKQDEQDEQDMEQKNRTSSLRSIFWVTHDGIRSAYSLSPPYGHYIHTHPVIHGMLRVWRGSSCHGLAQKQL